MIFNGGMVLTRRLAIVSSISLNLDGIVVRDTIYDISEALASEGVYLIHMHKKWILYVFHAPARATVCVVYIGLTRQCGP